jgi:glycosyltransferase involved in cell wall biosynthesis
MPKIAHFIDSHDPGGAESVVIDLCRSIGPYGYSAEVYHFGNPWLERRCEELGIPAVYVPGHRFYKSAATIPLFTAGFSRFLRERHVDLLHSHLFGPVSSACYSAFIARIPHVGTLHDVYTVDEKKSRIRYLTASHRFGTRLVAVSRQMKTYFDVLGNYREGVVQTIVNGVDIDRYQCGESENRRAELQITGDTIVFICVGRLEKIKGHADLITAFGQLTFGHEVLLLIVGEGPCREELERQIDHVGLNGRVKLLGHRDDVPVLLNTADCFVLSSYSEGLSCSIIEAMASGLPVIATNVGGNRELVQEDVNGFLVPPHAPNALLERLKSIVADAQLRARLGRASLSRAREEYSLRTMVREYSALYDRMIRKFA